jgi:hypothetical protein
MMAPAAIARITVPAFIAQMLPIKSERPMN